MCPIGTRSRVGADGLLMISLPLGLSEANRKVKVVVESTDVSVASLPCGRDDRTRFVKSMAGSISDPTFQRPEEDMRKTR
jgi:hypothetical protein